MFIQTTFNSGVTSKSDWRSQFPWFPLTNDALIPIVCDAMELPLISCMMLEHISLFHLNRNALNYKPGCSHTCSNQRALYINDHSEASLIRINSKWVRISSLCVAISIDFFVLIFGPGHQYVRRNLFDPFIARRNYLMCQRPFWSTHHSIHRQYFRWQFGFYNLLYQGGEPKKNIQNHTADAAQVTDQTMFIKPWWLSPKYEANESHWNSASI